MTYYIKYNILNSLIVERMVLLYEVKSYKTTKEIFLKVAEFTNSKEILKLSLEKHHCVEARIDKS